MRSSLRARTHACASLVAALLLTGLLSARAADVPQPLLIKDGPPVDWWFVFKFGASKPFAGCGPVTGQRQCPFGGVPLTSQSFGQQFAFSSSKDPELQQGKGCLGAQVTDPVGATFEQIYKGNFFYVLWNDQFYGDPKVCGSAANCTGHWGHSKGLLAWNNDGNGMIMQVSTPSWPGSGSERIKRKTGNTLGCVSSNNNLKASQHFFALKLDKADLLTVLEAMRRANVATDPKVSQVVSNGGPADVRAAVLKLGAKPSKADKFDVMHEKLSIKVNGKPVELIAKPSNLKVPPWQLVSALLGGASARAATWWTKPKIPTSTKSTKLKCWDKAITAKPGGVDIALTGDWNGSSITLYAPSNHAKIGTGDSGGAHYAIFGDLNQQGSLSPPPDCDSSQNGRGGMFFVLQDPKLFDSMRDLIHGDTASTSKQ